MDTWRWPTPLGLSLILLFLVACYSAPATETPGIPPATGTPDAPDVTATPAPSATPSPTPDLDQISVCSADDDCLVVRRHYCGGATAINAASLDPWNRHLEEIDREHAGVVCEPTLPLEEYEALCLNRHCAAVLRENRAILAFSDPPLLGQPVQLRFSIRFASDAPNTTARVELPEGFQLVSGELEWEGDLTGGKDHVLEAVVKALRPGFFELKATALPAGQEPRFALSDSVRVEVTATAAIFGAWPENHWGRSYAYPVFEPTQLIQSALEFSPAPGLGQVFTMTYRVTSTIDLVVANRAQLSLVLPPGAFEIVAAHFPAGGEPYTSADQVSWNGTIRGGQAVELAATLRGLATGWGIGYGSLGVQAGGELRQAMGDSIVVELHVDPYAGRYRIIEP